MSNHPADRPEGDANDIPDIPPHILARKPLALTPLAAESQGSNRYMDEGGRIVGDARRAASKAEKAAAQRAEAFAGSSPLRGLTPIEIDAVRGVVYPDAPKMDPALGDRTVAFKNWLWARHPKDASMRYGGTRGIYPSALPAVWPPKGDPMSPEMHKLLDKPMALALAGVKTYTQAEVDALLAGKTAAPKTFTQAEVDALLAGKGPAVIRQPGDDEKDKALIAAAIATPFKPKRVRAPRPSRAKSAPSTLVTP